MDSVLMKLPATTMIEPPKAPMWLYGGQVSCGGSPSACFRPFPPSAGRGGMQATGNVCSTNLPDCRSHGRCGLHAPRRSFPRLA
jgi:hypothetical protein